MEASRNPTNQSNDSKIRARTALDCGETSVACAAPSCEPPAPCIGYYIAPALFGGSDGVLISNLIAYHMQRSLNWSLAAALSGILLIGVLALYWVYGRLTGGGNLALGR